MKISEKKDAPVIVIADDDDDFRSIICSKLKNAGFDVHEARNGAEAISVANEFHPNLVVFDIDMPVMNGIEAFFRLKADPRFRNVKKVFLTNYGDPAQEASWIDEKFSREMGAIDYIQKSENLQTIIETLKKILRVS